MGGSRSTRRETTHTQEEHANPRWGLNQEPSRCEATVLTTTPPCSPLVYQIFWNASQLMFKSVEKHRFMPNIADILNSRCMLRGDFPEVTLGQQGCILSRVIDLYAGRLCKEPSYWSDLELDDEVSFVVPYWIRSCRPVADFDIQCTYRRGNERIREPPCF